MDIQESNNVTISDTEIKVGNFEESSSVNKPSAQIISIKCEIKDEDFEESQLLIQEELDIKNEDVEEDSHDSKYFDPNYEESLKTFICKYCCTGLSTEKYKIAHEHRCILRRKKQSLGETVFECSYCKLLYTVEEDKNKHQVLCKNRIKSEKYEVNTTKKGERKYCCDKCSYETKRNSCLISHIRIHDKVNAPKYSCLQCPYQSIYKSDLKRHLRTHNCFGLICFLCLTSFKHKMNLDAHYVSRHPDRSEQWRSTITYQIKECPKCLYKTVRTSDFKNHLTTHVTQSDQSWFKCNICGYKSKEKCSLIRHLRIHVGQLPFVCIKCNKRFNRKVHLDGHIISRHSDNEELVSSVTRKLHQCEKCDYKTIDSAKFKRHLKTCL